MDAKNDKVTSPASSQQADVLNLNVSAGQLARLLSRSPSTIDFWTRAEGMPNGPDGFFTLSETLRWLRKGQKIGLERKVLTGQFSQKQVAVLFGMTRETVSSWTRAGLPCGRDGTYSVGVVVRWLRTFYRASAQKEYERRLSAMRRKVTRNVRQLERFLAGGK